VASALVALAGAFASAAVVSTRRAALGDRLGLRPASAPRSATTVEAKILTSLAVLAVAVALIAGPPVAIGGAAAAACILIAIRRRRARRETRARADALPDAAAALAAGLRAGLSIPQAIAYARDESPGQLRIDLGRLTASVELGTPVGDALTTWAEETGSGDARLIAAVMDLHRRTGGDLPSVLDGVVATLRDRRAALREVRALTAQARLSGAILGALPIGFFAFLLLTARHEMLAAISTPLGRTAVVLGLGLELAAFAWIRRLLAVR
jgi:tight adherence protein B